MIKQYFFLGTRIPLNYVRETRIKGQTFGTIRCNRGCCSFGDVLKIQLLPRYVDPLNTEEIAAL